ncbi:tripartite tricarboxylate transporter TctB family protein [Xanthobacter sediminis]
MVDIDLTAMSQAQRKSADVLAPPRAAPGRRASLRARLVAASPYLVIFLAGIFLYACADRIDFDRTEGRMGPDVWPKMIVGLMMLTSFYGSIKALFFASAPVELPVDMAEAKGPGELEAATELDDGAGLDESEVYPLRVWGTLAATIAYLLAMPWLGFFVATVPFVGLIVFLGGYRKTVPIILVAFFTTAFFMIMFMRIIYVSLPIGSEPFSTVSLALIKLINLW